RILPAPRGRVLVVDAHPDMRELLLTILKTEGYDVDLAEDGELALARCRTRPADVALMDLDLPGKPGAAAIRELGAEFPDVVWVGVSAHAAPVWHDALPGGGIAGPRPRVRKPLEPWLLLRALGGLL